MFLLVCLFLIKHLQQQYLIIIFIFITKILYKSKNILYHALVTTGQLYEESLAIDEDYTTLYGNGDYHINFRSTRDGSKYVADVFNKYANEIAICSDLYIPYMYPFADMKPEMLNFILVCQLYLDDVLVGSIYIAQGHMMHIF